MMSLFNCPLLGFTKEGAICESLSFEPFGWENILEEEHPLPYLHQIRLSNTPQYVQMEGKFSKRLTFLALTIYAWKRFKDLEEKQKKMSRN